MGDSPTLFNSYCGIYASRNRQRTWQDDHGQRHDAAVELTENRAKRPVTILVPQATRRVDQSDRRYHVGICGGC
jgi:hypothetical protein